MTDVVLEGTWGANWVKATRVVGPVGPRGKRYQIRIGDRDRTVEIVLKLWAVDYEKGSNTITLAHHEMSEPETIEVTKVWGWVVNTAGWTIKYGVP